jgi:hypothetical protein
MRYFPGICLEELRNTKKSQDIGILAKFRTENLSNKSPEPYRYTNLLRAVRYKRNNHFINTIKNKNVVLRLAANYSFESGII